MATWGELLLRLKELLESGEPAPHDKLRREALATLHQYTGRNTILYAAGHLQKPQAGQEVLSISDEDLEGFMEVIYGLEGDQLDLILHSPGGVAEAADSLVQYLRSKLSDIRVIVPQMAMSAATMMACAANRIVMGRHSKLGPIDPQLQMRTEIGVQLVPAQAVLDQFERAKEECVDQPTLAVWYPILRQYGPALLVQCQNAINHSKGVVAQWLAEFMFAGREDAAERAQKIADALGEHGVHLTHGRPLGKEYLRDELGLEIDNLEDDQELQDRVLTVYHAFMHTFMGTGAAKLIENHVGRAWVKMVRPIPAPTAKPEEEAAESQSA